MNKLFYSITLFLALATTLPTYGIITTMGATVTDGRIIIYSKEEHDDNSLHIKEPFKFSKQIRSFLNE